LQDEKIHAERTSHRYFKLSKTAELRNLIKLVVSTAHRKLVSFIS